MTTIPDISTRCTKCGRTWGDLLSFALLMDLGAKVYPSPLDCDHEWREKT